MTAGDFHRSAPLPVPLTPAALQLGQERLRRLQDAGATQVGLENLAFAFGRQDVADQGRFLDELLQPVDGFLLLDLAQPVLPELQLRPVHRGADGLVSAASRPRAARLRRQLEPDHATAADRGGELGTKSQVTRARSNQSTGAKCGAIRTTGRFRTSAGGRAEWRLARCPNVRPSFSERLGGTFSFSRG